MENIITISNQEVNNLIPDIQSINETLITKSLNYILTKYNIDPSSLKNIKPTKKNKIKIIPTENDLKNNFIKITQIELPDPDTNKTSIFHRSDSGIIFRFISQKPIIVGKIIGNEVHWYI